MLLGRVNQLHSPCHVGRVESFEEGGDRCREGEARK